MAPKKTLSNWLTNRYLLIIRNEENFAEKSTFSFTYAKVIVFIFSIFLIFLLVSLYLVSTVLSQWLDPRYTSTEMNKRIIEMSVQVDSLSNQVEKKELLIQNIQGIIRGETVSVEIARDSSKVSINDLNKEIDVSEVNAIDASFRKEFEKSGIDMMGLANNQADTKLQEMFFFTPVDGGVISSPYNAKNEHYAIDIVAKKNEPIKCIADGTVIMADKNLEGGYVIAVQHSSNLISVYKHNSALLKKVGNFVKAGDVIAIMGNTGDLTTGPHLHFELWFNGTPVNPANFISF